MDFFQRLPSEILVNILSRLAPTDLVSVSRLTHHFHAVSHPLLFNAPSLATDGDSSSLEQFLNQLLSPGGESLGTLVRTLTIYWEHPNDARQVRSWYPDGIPLSSNSLATLCCTSPNMQVLLLLLRVPRLDSLNIHWSGWWNCFDEFMRGCCTGVPPSSFLPAFQSLRSFCCTSAVNTDLVDEQTLLILLSMPSIRSITTAFQDSYTEIPHQIPTASSSVTSLRLGNSDVRPAFLTHILTISKSLCSFYYRGETSALDGSVLPFHTCLLAVHNTLQHLYLDLYLCHPNEDEQEDEEHIQSLRDWPLLRVLWCSLKVLLWTRSITDMQKLTDVIPPGIHELCILPDNYFTVSEALQEVLNLLERKDEVVPFLQKVWVCGTDTAQQDVLRGVGEAHGVEVVVDVEWMY